jgi:hypothetical protein
MTVKKPLNSVMPWQPIVTHTNEMLLVLARRSFVQFYVTFSDSNITVLLQSNMTLDTQCVEVGGTGWWYMILSFQVYPRSIVYFVIYLPILYLWHVKTCRLWAG